jgi:Ala-tRNA(Pro) deacylase
MSISTRLSSYLSQQGARYELCPHELSHSSAETARAAHVPAGALAKPVLLEDDDGRCVMAIVPADRNVSLDEVADLVGCRDLRLSSEDRIAQTFDDCDRGAVPPVGMAWGIETVVDDQLESHEVVYLEGGDHQQLLRMSHDQFRELMNGARHGPISRPIVH